MAADNLSGLERTVTSSASEGQEGLVRPGFWRGLATCLACENCTIKGNLRLPDVTLCAIKYNTMGLGRLH